MKKVQRSDTCTHVCMYIVAVNLCETKPYCIKLHILQQICIKLNKMLVRLTHQEICACRSHSCHVR
jgi:hypothetical protein